MSTSTAPIAGAYTPPDPASPAWLGRHVDELVVLLNDAIRALHQAGAIVLVAEDHHWSLRTIGGVTERAMLPQVRVDVRPSIEAATSRPETLDG